MCGNSSACAFLLVLQLLCCRILALCVVCMCRQLTLAHQNCGDALLVPPLALPFFVHRLVCCCELVGATALAGLAESFLGALVLLKILAAVEVRDVDNGLLTGVITVQGAPGMTYTLQYTFVCPCSCMTGRGW